MELLSWENPVFCCYAFYSIILILKMFVMAVYTGVLRFKKQVYVNGEDAASAGVDVKKDDPDVDRIRRAHMNDLENLPLFFISGLIFILTDPNVMFALMLFRLFVVARIIHTIAYCCLHNKAARSISFFLGLLINIIMFTAS